MKSTSKGVISALVGIALHERFIESLDDSFLSYLPDYEPKDTGKAEITIRDLLTMSSGLKWNENDLNSVYTIFLSNRIAGRVLNRPLVEEPGTRFNYSTGVTHLLSADQNCFAAAGDDKDRGNVLAGGTILGPSNRS